MPLEKQVSSLTLSQRLKELGVKQESLVYWTKLDLKDWEVQQGVEEYSVDYFGESIPSEGVSAFTVAELGEMLPRYIADKDQPLSGVKGKQYPLIIECLGDDYSSDNKINGWRIRYGDTKVKIDSEHKLNSAGIYYVGTEADARAKMLIYLLENGLTTK